MNLCLSIKVTQAVKYYEHVTKISESLENAIKHKRGSELEEAIEEAKLVKGWGEGGGVMY
jgi:hypothetical protein